MWTSRIRNLTANLLIVMGSVLATLVLIEIVLRMFFPIPYSMEVEYVPDGHLGTRLQPDRVYTLKLGGVATVNNLGFRRSTDLSIVKPDNMIRIVALGGSSTFSYHVDDAHVWVARLENQLRAHYGDHIEVINAGVPGYSVFESKINYLYQVRPLEPDIVIVYHTWNDLKYFHRIETGNYPKKGVSSGNSWMRSLLRNFQIAWRARNFIDEVIYPSQRENSFGSQDNVEVAISPGGPAHKWERQNYTDLATLLRVDGVIPVFTSQGGLLSEDNMNDPAVRANIYAEYVNLSFEEILTQWLAVSDMIKSVAQENDILFVDIYNQVPHTSQYFLDHVHLTEDGNAKVADLLYAALVSNEQLDETLSTQGE